MVLILPSPMGLVQGTELGRQSVWDDVRNTQQSELAEQERVRRLLANNQTLETRDATVDAINARNAYATSDLGRRGILDTAAFPGQLATTRDESNAQVIASDLLGQLNVLPAEANRQAQSRLLSAEYGTQLDPLAQAAAYGVARNEANRIIGTADAQADSAYNVGRTTGSITATNPIYGAQTTQLRSQIDRDLARGAALTTLPAEAINAYLSNPYEGTEALRSQGILSDNQQIIQVQGQDGSIVPIIGTFDQEGNLFDAVPASQYLSNLSSQAYLQSLPPAARNTVERQNQAAVSANPLGARVTPSQLPGDAAAEQAVLARRAAEDARTGRDNPFIGAPPQDAQALFDQQAAQLEQRYNSLEANLPPDATTARQAIATQRQTALQRLEDNRTLGTFVNTLDAVFPEAAAVSNPQGAAQLMNILAQGAGIDLGAYAGVTTSQLSQEDGQRLGRMITYIRNVRPDLASSLTRGLAGRSIQLVNGSFQARRQ